MRYIDLHGSGGPTLSNGHPDHAWLAQAQQLFLQLQAAPNKAARDTIVDANAEVWKGLREWLLRLSHDKCWYSEARDSFSVPEVDHFRPKCRCKRAPRGQILDGYWWLAFEWRNLRICGKVGNARKGDFFPLAVNSPVGAYGGISIANEVPLLLDPTNPADPQLLDFNEDGGCNYHADADAFSQLRVTTTITRLNLNHGRLKKARLRIWERCRALITECRELAHQLSLAPAAAERDRLSVRTDELRRMVRPEFEFSSVARECLMKSNIGWVQRLVAG